MGDGDINTNVVGGGRGKPRTLCTNKVVKEEEISICHRQQMQPLLTVLVLHTNTHQ